MISGVEAGGARGGLPVPEAGPARSVAPRREPWLTTRALISPPVLAVLAAVAVATVLLVAFDGAAYYSSPLRTRGYHPAHRLLRPSGSAGHLLGIAGLLVMAGTLLYPLRKRARPLARAGKLPGWLEVHVFCGVLGPLLVTFHTSFKFNGIVSVAYWSMVLVSVSGFVGRYLFVRIPRTQRGAEVAAREVEERAQSLRQELLDTTLPTEVLSRIEAFERDVVPPPGVRPSLAGLFAGDLVTRVKRGRLLREIERAGVGHELLGEASRLVAERAALLRRAAYLARTKQLFGLWHVFHVPLVWVTFLIAALHVVVALYFGYAFGGHPGR